MANTATTRELTLTLSAPVINELETLAAYLDRELDYVITSAAQAYLEKWKVIREELEAPIDPSNPDSMSLAQVSAMIKQMRREDEEAKAA